MALFALFPFKAAVYNEAQLFGFIDQSEKKYSWMVCCSEHTMLVTCEVSGELSGDGSCQIYYIYGLARRSRDPGQSSDRIVMIWK